MSRNIKHCVDLVRKYDYENYLCTLLLPSNSIRSAFAIRALNVTLSQVRDIASDKRTQQFRYAFWQDAIRTLHSHRHELPKSGELGSSTSYSALNAFRSPVFDELCAAVIRDNLSVKWLSRLVDARVSTLERADVFVRVGDLERYGEETACCVIWLLLEAIGVRNILCDHIASHIGKAQTLSLHVRSLSYNITRHADAALPHELLAKHGVSQRDLVRVARSYAKQTDLAKSNPATKPHQQSSSAKTQNTSNEEQASEKLEAVCNIVHEVASRAFEHVRIARNLFNSGTHGQEHEQGSSHCDQGATASSTNGRRKSATSQHVRPVNALPVFLSCVPSAAYLSRLERVNFNVFDSRLAHRDGLLPFRLLLAKYRSRF